MRVDVVFTCWPPGPLDRDARYSSSDLGTETPGAMFKNLESAISQMPLKVSVEAADGAWLGQVHESLEP
jgi:hypothetical protein